ncbi:MAG: MFS transporter [Deltaproteobacteria bacterium]|nr:MFS transporter [Deltaproteobacteria bacterium]
MADTTDSAAPESPAKFPRTFWTANLTELFERGAYYSMASFVVIYLGRLGLGDYWPSVLNGLLWTLVYFLPILSGTIADQVGFRRSLLVAFVLLAGGYFLMGFPAWLGGATLTPEVGSEVTAGGAIWAPLLVGIVLIGLGGSVIKPCISGSVQKTAGKRATLAFAIFYMVINIGSLFGRGVSWVVRSQFGLPYIFAVAMGCSVIAFFVVTLLYEDPDRLRLEAAAAPARPKRSVGRILLDMVLVLKNPRFALFLLVSSGFNFLYAQVYNVLPLYLKKVVETDPAVDIYTMANPLTIVLFQLLVTRLFGKMKPIRSMVVGSLIIGVAMLINIVPVLVLGDLRGSVFDLLPLGSVFIVLTVSLIAFGELFTMARTYEYIGALAPKGQEGLFLGYANLPMAIGSLLGGPVGAFIFNEIMCHGATKRPDGLLELDPNWNSLGWTVLMGIGFLSALAMFLYNRWLERHPATPAPAT